ncbi:MAG: hypothetical protein FWB72_06780, partial [Firmicutes bacterium]|nr:hypothetical protein [Bacillota bacterium]
MRKISKQFKRLAILALGLSIALAGVLGIVHFNNASGSEEYAYANAGRTPANLRINGTTLSWQFWWQPEGFDGGFQWVNRPSVGNFRVQNTQILRAGTVVHTLNTTIRCCCNGGNIPPANSINMNNVAALAAVGSHSITIRTNFREYTCCCSGASGQFIRNVSHTSTAINRTVTGTLGVPGNVRMVDNTLHWNAVGNANGYRVYRGGVHISTPGNVTSLNLAGHANIAAGSLHNFTVRATSTASYWNTSGHSAGVNWGHLAAPSASVSGTTLSW